MADQVDDSDFEAEAAARPIGRIDEGDRVKDDGDERGMIDLHVDVEAPNQVPDASFGPLDNWRPAKSLVTLKEQVNRRAPGRRKDSDGTIGNEAHCHGGAPSSSDHCPWVRDGNTGVVTAIDITHDPRPGMCDAGALAEALRASDDPRLKYIIWNRRIANSSAIGSARRWQWRAYGGSNPHDKHVHISVKPEGYDSTSPWSIGG